MFKLSSSGLDVKFSIVGETSRSLDIIAVLTDDADRSTVQREKTAGGFFSTSQWRVRWCGLICWEHWMPLARMAMHQAGEHIHVAVWPTVNEMAQLASRHYAIEGRCFVLAVGLMMRTTDIPARLPHDIKEHWAERGGSSIIGPDAGYVVEPIYDREQLIIADLDLSMIDRECMSLDVTGQYARPDIFSSSHRTIKQPAPNRAPGQFQRLESGAARESRRRIAATQWRRDLRRQECPPAQSSGVSNARSRRV